MMCDTHIWTETDLGSYVRNYYVHGQVRAVSRWRVLIQTRFEIFKYLIKKKIPVYGWQGDYVWYPHMNRNWFGVICKELLCPMDKLEPFLGDRVLIQTRFEIFKYLIKEKIPVYGWQGDDVWYPHMNRKLIWGHM